MNKNRENNFSLEEKAKIIKKAAEEIDLLYDEQYQKIKIILDRNSAQREEEFTLTVGIQNAYLG